MLHPVLLQVSTGTRFQLERDCNWNVPGTGLGTVLKGLEFMRFVAAVTLSISLFAVTIGSAAEPQTFPVSGQAMTSESRRAISDLVWDRSQPLRDDGARSLQQRRLAGEKAPATLNAIVMMCDFADSLMLGRLGQVPGDFPPAMQTDRHYAAHDSVFFDHMLSKVADYFWTVSGQKLTINSTVHPRTVNLPEPMSFYGNHPEEGDQHILLTSQVVDSLSSEIDFSAYDTIILVHAGAGEETDILSDSPEQIFSTYLDPADFAAAAEDGLLDQPYLPAPGFAPGMGIDRVLILPETEQQDAINGFGGGFGSLGVYCFEVGLHLGMLSLTDFTPSGRPDSQGIGQYGLMGFGLFVGLGFIPPQPCAYNKLLMGWVDPYDADATVATRYGLTPAGLATGPWPCARVSLTGQEFWLLEYRLQDPNGDRRYSFGDDKNGNGLPDFYDADSDSGDGTPTGKFDPATDLLERVIDAEWDFAMSENNERVFGELGWGSGVYVWHIDESVILDVFDAPSNLFNADPQRKAVDLEEADGIQDLDSNEPSAFMIGSDDDSFRGEFAHEFLPTTRPRTDTASGVGTGIEFRDFSDVVADSFLALLFVDNEGIEYWAFDYADTMFFTLQASTGSATAPRLHARRDLPVGTDLRGSHVLVGNLDQLGGSDEIILAGHAGEVFVLDGDLNEFLDRDADPATLEPFVVGTRGGVPVAWNLPAAMGDIDGDKIPEIVLTGAGGVYAFASDGTAVRDAEFGSFGFYFEVMGCVLPPVLVPVTATLDSKADAAAAVEVLVVEQGPAGARLIFLSGADATEISSVPLGQGLVPAPPAMIDRFVVTAVADTGSGSHFLNVVERVSSILPVEPRQLVLPLAGTPGALPLVLGVTIESDPDDPVYFVSVIDTAGHGETLFFDNDLSSPRAPLPWPDHLVVTSPIGLGGAFVAEDVLGRVGHGGDWQTGWPRRPLLGGLAGDAAWQGTPLVARLLNSPHNLDQFVFPTRDGRLFATGFQGEWEQDWPLAGPAASSGTPALGRLTGTVDADLVAIGTYDRITGTDGAELSTVPTASVSIWRDVAVVDPVWPMHGGSIWRNGAYDLSSWTSGLAVASGSGLVSGSHFCFPSPLQSGNLKVSGRVRSAARAMVVVYNLEGEKVRETGWREVGAVDPFVIEIDLPGAVTGLYLCRLVVDTPGQGTDQSVTQFAIVR